MATVLLMQRGRKLHAGASVVHENLWVCAGCGGPILNRLYRSQPYPTGWVHVKDGAPCAYSGAVFEIRARHYWPHLCPLCGDLTWALDCTCLDQHDCWPHQECIMREKWLADRVEME